MELDEPSFFVGVMHMNRDPWLSIVRDGQSRFWDMQRNSVFEVVYFYGKTNKFYTLLNHLIEKLRWDSGRKASYGIAYALMIGLAPWKKSIPLLRKSSLKDSGLKFPSVEVKVPEMISTMRWKKISILEYFLVSSKAEFLIITNSSSILNFQPLEKFIVSNIDKSKPLYAGPIHSGYDGDFVSGSFTLMNRKSAEILLAHRSSIPLHVMDDIGFGTAFSKLGILPCNYNSLVLSSEAALDAISDEEIISAGHIRLKAGTLHNRSDVQIAHKLLERMSRYEN